MNRDSDKKIKQRPVPFYETCLDVGLDQRLPIRRVRGFSDGFITVIP